jgi:hypothetical protein
MNELLELMPVPGERELPPGRLEERRAGLLAAIEAEPVAGRRRVRLGMFVRGWLASIGLLLACLVVFCSFLVAGGPREQQGESAAKTVLVVAGASGIAAFAVAPGPPRLARVH